MTEVTVEDLLKDHNKGERSFHVKAAPINEEKRTVDIAISSEEPYMRYFGNEVLGHKKGEIDMDFLSSGRAPLLLDHDPEKQIGVIKSVELDEEGGRLRAKVRFGKGALAQEAFTDVVDEIKANISVGYEVHDMTLVGKDGDDNTYRVNNWRPVEASLVSIPADVTVGVGRSGEAPKPPETEIKQEIEEKKMSEEIKTPEIDVAGIEAKARKAAEKNAAEIIELGARHNQGGMAREFIASGKSVDTFRGALLETIGSDTALENGDIGMKSEEVKQFSLVRLINALANPSDMRSRKAAEFEFECTNAAADKFAGEPQGVILPADVLRSWKRDLNSADDAAMFGDDYRGESFIDVLRNNSSVMQAGARTLSGLTGDVVIPKKTAASSAGWIATEGGAASESEFTVGTVSLTPKQIGAFTDMTRQLRQQSSMDVENMIRDDLGQAIALAIDLGGLEGTGADGQPTGLLNQASLTKVTAWAAANPTFAEVVTLETAVADANALMGNLSYICPTNMVGAMKTTEKASGTAQFLTDGKGLNGHRLVSSNQGTAGNMYFGNWNDLLLGFWSGLDLLVDPYSLSNTGSVRVNAFQTCDVAVRHVESFAYGNDTA
jgi:hypothetical protein